ncbi:amidohydrolase family protein [Aquiflexum lacus]|uniref:amidohydrolase family protein n=1 Tax=Aquiflexum lacus TaxID=2483805 RepID=UPI001894CBEA|nr:amidohydrolase family protein [Aquiflexum lacus]
MQLDSHQHFWKFDPVRDAWIDSSMKVIQRDFLPKDLKPELDKAGIDGCIAVQADQSEMETNFLLQIANANPWVKKVVAWVDFFSADVESKLEVYQSEKKLAGFRVILQALPPEAMEDKFFLNSISLLEKYGFTYDILIYPKHLEKAFHFAKKFPKQPFVIDHLAKPDIKNGEFEFWSQGMKAMALLPNVSCKVSGMVTEANWYHWEKEQFYPYLDFIAESFGTKRLMYGSDWPVCLLAATYQEVYAIPANFFKNFSSNEKAAIFGENAARFYKI